jgi:hypothetical protein
MRRIHDFITRYWRALLITFIVLSSAFAFLNSRFSQEAERGCFMDIPLERVNSQAFTSSLSFAALDESAWQSFVACYAANPTAKSLNTAVFLLDDVWAISFLLVIYLLANVKNFTFTPLKRILFGLLFVAYAFDFTENAIYLTLSEVSWLPAIGTLKLLFYGAAILLACIALVRNLLSPKRTEPLL